MPRGERALLQKLCLYFTLLLIDDGIELNSTLYSTLFLPLTRMIVHILGVSPRLHRKNTWLSYGKIIARSDRSVAKTLA